MLVDETQLNLWKALLATFKDSQHSWQTLHAGHPLDNPAVFANVQLIVFKTTFVFSTVNNLCFRGFWSSPTTP